VAYGKYALRGNDVERRQRIENGYYGGVVLDCW
jgi:hypothetical protein